MRAARCGSARISADSATYQECDPGSVKSCTCMPALRQAAITTFRSAVYLGSARPTTNVPSEWRHRSAFSGSFSPAARIRSGWTAS